MPHASQMTPRIGKVDERLPMLCFSARRSSEAAPVSYYTAALEEVPACRLLCYLYENSIGPEQLRDVLSDFCGRTL